MFETGCLDDSCRRPFRANGCPDLTLGDWREPRIAPATSAFTGTDPHKARSVSRRFGSVVPSYELSLIPGLPLVELRWGRRTSLLIVEVPKSFNGGRMLGMPMHLVYLSLV